MVKKVRAISEKCNPLLQVQGWEHPHMLPLNAAVEWFITLPLYLEGSGLNFWHQVQLLRILWFPLVPPGKAKCFLKYATTTSFLTLLNSVVTIIYSTPYKLNSWETWCTHIFTFLLMSYHSSILSQHWNKILNARLPYETNYSWQKNYTISYPQCPLLARANITAYCLTVTNYC
jgi:hypothetical protein